LAASAKKGELKVIAGERLENLGKPHLFGRLCEFIAALAADLRGGEPARERIGRLGRTFPEAPFLGELMGCLELIRLFRRVQKKTKPKLETLIDQNGLQIYTPSLQATNFWLACARKLFLP